MYLPKKWKNHHGPLAEVKSLFRVDNEIEVNNFFVILYDFSFKTFTFVVKDMFSLTLRHLGTFSLVLTTLINLF